MTDGDLVKDAGRALDSGRLTDLRRLRLRALIRDNPTLIDVDDHGAPVVRGEVLANSPTPGALDIARRAGFAVKSTNHLEALALDLVVLTAPKGLSSRDAVRRLRKLDPAGRYDFNTIYSGAGTEGPSVRAAQAAAPVGGAGSGVRIGLVDGGVDAGHPAFAGIRVEQRGFAPGAPLAQAHGTAVASLMVGRAGPFHGAVPGAALYVADVYGSGPTGGAADTVVRALGWMAEVRAPVINISLVGPPNAALEAAVRALIARGQAVVAAVGNDGPAAPPLYPASYPGVVAVTAVDGRRKLLLEAGRARHVDFAAPGADMAAARAGGGFAAVRGTSFAAPIVAGELAARMRSPGLGARDQAIGALDQQAIDLGPRGPDKTYGHGLVGEDVRTPPAAVAAVSAPGL